MTRFNLRRVYPDRTVERDYEFKLHEAEVPESEFTLPAFGFPAPTNLPTPRSYWYLWFIGIAAVCLVGGWYLLRRARSKSGVNAKVGNHT